MTTTPAPATPPPPDSGGSRRRRIMLLAIVVGVLAVMSVPIITTIFRQNDDAWRINDNVTITVHQVISEPGHEVHALPWYLRAFYSVADPFKKKFGGPAWFERNDARMSSFQNDTVFVLLKVHHPRSWHSTTNAAFSNTGQTEFAKLTELNQYAIDSSLEFRSDGGLRDTNLQILGTARHPATFLSLRVPQTDIIPTEPNLYVHFLKPKMDAFSITPPDPEILHTFVVPNPLYNTDPPALIKPTQMPTTVTHNDVTVTLHNVYGRASSSGINNTPQRPRAAGTYYDRNRTRIDASISQADRSTSDFAIKSINSYFVTAKGEYPFARNTGHIPSTGAKDDHDMYFLSQDITALGRPSKLEVTLKRIRNFPADEIQTIEIPMPPDGETFIGTESTSAAFWNGRVQLKEIASNARITLRQTGAIISKSDDRQQLFLLLQSTNPDTNAPLMITSGTLSSPDQPPADLLSSFFIGTQSHFNHSASESNHLFALENTRRFGAAESPAPKLSNYTTLSLTLTRPRDFPHTFEFVVEPTDAPE